MPITDYIFIEEMDVACQVGTSKEERAFPQIIKLSVELELPLSKAGATDDLKHTIDYVSVVNTLQKFLTRRSFNLVESVAHLSANLLLDKYPVNAVRIKVAKPILPGINYLGATVRRTRES